MQNFKNVFKSITSKQDSFTDDDKENLLQQLHDTQQKLRETELLAQQKLKEVELIAANELSDAQQKLKEVELIAANEKKEKELMAAKLNSWKLKKYDKVVSCGSLYVLKTDSDDFYKIGKTKELKKRLAAHQTSNEADIQTLLNFDSCNPDLLEKCVHFCLDRYRSNSNREFFECDLPFIKNVVDILGHALDTIKSSYPNITRTELINILLQKLHFNHSEIDPHLSLSTQENLPAPSAPPQDSLYDFLLNNSSFVFKKSEFTFLEDVRLAYSATLERDIRRLDHAVFLKVNQEWKVEKLDFCKFCKNIYKRGCCNQYQRGENTKRATIKNMLYCKNSI
ncbi:hypothetical protein HK099_007063 [Clydaea vesicula]|uniref:Bacteriophage T5 Orf172 DNA-binding domain-containing protein n=1 Tax=Clydaea vesicula TaxID=447962 RepID=A0AAD5U0G3_9FUNG|nr:hypothetical protein HK099_007063 [Clydaea vesicula]